HKYMKHDMIKHLSLITAVVVAAGCSTPRSETGMFPPAPTKESQAAMSPDSALAELRAGNQRFVSGHSQVRDLPAKARDTAAGQYPFAVILSCLDSRQPTEIVF